MQVKPKSFYTKQSFDKDGVIALRARSIIRYYCTFVIAQGVNSCITKRFPSLALSWYQNCQIIRLFAFSVLNLW